MKNHRIGVASSIYADEGFDPIKTGTFCRDNNLGVIQHYLDKSIEESNETLDKLRIQAEQFELQLICHSPYYLDNSVCKSRHINQIKKIFPSSKPKIIVVHFNENSSINEAITAVKYLNDNGVTPALENFYIDKSEKSLENNINCFVEIIDRAKDEGLELIPLIDFPRLFIKDFEEFNPMVKTLSLLTSISQNYNEIIIHTIDFSNSSQDRDSWVPIGTGLMDYGQIFSKVKDLNININYAILEYEEVGLAKDSILNLNQLILN